MARVLGILCLSRCLGDKDLFGQLYQMLLYFADGFEWQTKYRYKKTKQYSKGKDIGS